MSPPDSVAPVMAKMKIKLPPFSADTARDLASIVKGFASIRAQNFTFFEFGLGSQNRDGGWLNLLVDENEIKDGILIAIPTLCVL